MPGLSREKEKIFMKNLKAKLRKNGGFTLIEMLIVVAIIAILIAVSIPLINNALDKTRHATDAANERAAKAEITIQYLADSDSIVYATGAADAVGSADFAAGTVYYYDAQNGRLCKAITGITAYGKCTKGSHDTNNILAVMISTDGLVSMQWTASAITGTTLTDTTLCGGKDVSHT